MLEFFPLCLHTDCRLVNSAFGKTQRWKRSWKLCCRDCWCTSCPWVMGKKGNTWSLPLALSPHPSQPGPPLPETRRTDKGTQIDQVLVSIIQRNIHIRSHLQWCSDTRPMSYSGPWISSLSSEAWDSNANFPLATEMYTLQEKSINI